MKSNMN